MPFLSATMFETIFYLVFAAQIALVSLYYPKQIGARILHVFDHYPPADYPKLYAGAGPEGIDRGRRQIALYLGVNRAIAVLGLIVLVSLIASGYEFGPKGGAELFVGGYFMVQALPYIYLAVAEFAQYKALRRAFHTVRRSADLTRRRLFDYIAPGYVVAAVVSYVVWVVFQIGGRPVSEWREDVYLAVPLITAMNVAYIFMIRHFISGRRLNPLAGPTDQFIQTEMQVKTLVLSSIFCSVFLTLMIAAGRYGFEFMDPIVTSLFLQLCMVFSVGMTLKSVNPKEVDFEVYRGNS
ncbi:hypothetical protein [Gimibacter soli]|uniref:Uncharacterized protein n=1 Tax=Gimibacter soli TaxID=3024400 RepID=A0AAE9XW73_9PROT|nr:hypothetical protein [Gimibacter soli]WCL55458.1 hypothetical protein PH603_06760 [Gimibacter soli]